MNINQSNDSNYRYKMDELIISYIGKSGKANKGFTILINIKTISEQLNHNYKTLLKYISLNLGCKNDDNKLCIQGHHDKNTIQNIIFNYINTFILCKKCSIPELQYKNKKNIIFTHCLGCGDDTNINEITLSKNNKKIYNNILSDINNNFFNTISNTTNITTIDTEFISTDDFF